MPLRRALLSTCLVVLVGGCSSPTQTPVGAKKNNSPSTASSAADPTESSSPSQSASPTEGTSVPQNPSESPAANSVLSKADLRAAQAELVAANTGHYEVTLRFSSEPAAASLPHVTGDWNLKQRASTVQAMYSLPDAGEVKANEVLIGRTGYVQFLSEGSIFAPNCWTRVDPAGQAGARLAPAVAAMLGARTGGGSADPATTIPLGDVLGAIGLQKGANALGNAVQQVRVEVQLTQKGGQLDGWAVSSSSLTGALSDPRLPGKSIKSLIDFLSQAGEEASWQVEFSQIGAPVKITPPEATSLIDASRETCQGR